MGILSRIKSLFKPQISRQTGEKTKTFGSNQANKNVDYEGITCYDSNLVPLPKYSELSDELKARVDAYYKEIKLEEYETLIKYGYDFQEKSKTLTKVIMSILDDINNSNVSYNNNKELKDIFKNMITSLINKEKLIFCSKQLAILYNEAWLRAIAVDRYAKKESLRQFDFLGIFGRAERLKYIKYKQTLRDAVQCSLITITVVENQLRCVLIALRQENKYNESLDIYTKLLSANSTNMFRNAECTKYLQDIKDEALFDFSLCFDAYNKEYELSDIIDDYDYLVTKSGVDKFDTNPLTEIEKEKLVSYEKRFAEIIAVFEISILIYALEHQNEYRQILDELCDDYLHFDDQISCDAKENEPIHLIDELKEKALYYHRFLVRVYKITGKDKDDEDKKYLMGEFCEDIIYFLIETGNFSFVEEKIQKGAYSGKYGVKIPDNIINEMLEEYMQKSIMNIEELYGVDVSEKVYALTELFLYKRHIFSDINNGKILDTKLVPTNIYYAYNRGTVSVNTKLRVEIPEIDYFILDKEYLEKNLISFSELFEYLEFIEYHLHRYNDIQGSEISRIIKTSLEYSPLYGYIVNNNEPAMLELTAWIIERGISKRFGFDDDIHYEFGKNQKYKIAFIPRIVKLINATNDDKIFLPIRYFNNNTKMLYIHDEFDFEESNLRPVFNRLKNLKTILVSKKKYDEIFDFINFPGGQFDNYEFEFVDSIPYGYDLENIVTEKLKQLYEGGAS